MAGRSRLSMIVAVGTGALTIVIAVAALLGGTEIALAGLGLLLGMNAVLLLAVFERVTNVSRAARAQSSGDRKVSGRAGAQAAIGGQLARNEEAERRIIAILEAERLRAADRHSELLAAAVGGGGGHDVAQEVIKATRASVRHAVTDLTVAGRNETRAVEALLQLTAGATFRAPLPPSGRWAMDARGILELTTLVKENDPRLVVELGGGTSTVWTAYLLEETGGKVVSIDHDAEFAEITRWSVARHGLSGVVDVRVAPLAPWQGDESTPWYDTSALGDLSEIDFLIVDGPPANLSESARTPALAAFADRLVDGALIVLDDVDRPSEEQTVAQWLEDFPALTRVPGDFGQLAVLRWQRGA